MIRQFKLVNILLFSFLFNCICNCQVDSIVYEDVADLTPRKEKLTISVLREKNRFGIKSNNGEVLIPAIYDFVGDPGEFTIVKKDNKYGVINLSNEVVIEIEYEMLYPLFRNVVGTTKLNSFPIIYKSGDSYGMISENGDTLIQEQKSILHIRPNDILVGNHDYKEGVVDRNGNYIVPQKYRRVRRINGIYYKVGYDKSTKYGLLDINGKEILPQIYDHIISDEDNFLLKSNNVVYKFSPITGEIKEIGKYDDMVLVNRFYKVKKGSLYGLTDRNYNLVEAIKYKSIERRNDYMILKDTTGHCHILDRHGYRMFNEKLKKCDMSSLYRLIWTVNDDNQTKIFDMNLNQVYNEYDSFKIIQKYLIGKRQDYFEFLYSEDNVTAKLAQNGIDRRIAKIDSLNGSVSLFESSNKIKYLFPLCKENVIPQIEEVLFYSYKVVIVKEVSTGKVGAIKVSSSPEILIPFIYDSIEIDKSDLFKHSETYKATKEGHVSYFDYKGEFQISNSR